MFQFIVENVAEVLMRRPADCQTDGHKSSSHAFMPFTAIYKFMNGQVNLMALKKTRSEVHVHDLLDTQIQTFFTPSSFLAPIYF